MAKCAVIEWIYFNACHIHKYLKIFFVYCIYIYINIRWSFLFLCNKTLSNWEICPILLLFSTFFLLCSKLCISSLPITVRYAIFWTWKIDGNYLRFVFCQSWTPVVCRFEQRTQFVRTTVWGSSDKPQKVLCGNNVGIMSAQV